MKLIYLVVEDTTGVVSVSNVPQPLIPGITRVYDVEVTDPGSGYTKIPSVTISGLSIQKQELRLLEVGRV